MPDSSKRSYILNPIQNGGPKRPPISLFPNVEINPQNFLTFSFNTFCHTDIKFQGHT